MTQPRIVQPGKTYLITRRIVLRHFLLRPDAEVTNLIFYALSVTLQRWGMQLHAICVMSDHIHLIVTDTRGCFPRFIQDFHRLVALGVARLRNWQGQVFEGKHTSVVELETPQSVIETIAYVLANPVEAGLVEHSAEWPGAKVLISDIGRGEIRAVRPNFYFSSKNEKWPETVTIPVSLPPMIDERHADGFREAVAAELQRTEAAAHQRMKMERRRFLGAKRARQVSPFDRATSEKPRNQRNPTFAVGRGQPAARKVAVERRRAFLLHYRTALDKWRKGKHDTVFPAGTWWLRVFYGARTTADFEDATIAI